MDRGTMKRTAAAIAALDFADENRRLAEIEEEIAATESAIRTATSRCEAIATAIAEKSSMDGKAVAAALMERTDATIASYAARDESSLREESASLRAGMKELQHSAEDLRSELSRVRAEAQSRVARAIKPLVDELLAEQQDLARQMVAGFATISALDAGFGGAMAARGAMEKAVAGIAGQDRLIPWRRSEAVPSEILDLFRGIDGGQALRARCPSEIMLP
ncbi:hypothetical protein GCM10023208_24600 [Erythrobacter westpacificensis]|uniref:Uncharacterized protein n=2 Tax=Erythrobacter westpacificensis TaxID=1055231 RepID=A0ABP9KH32_9SPHN